MKKICMIVTMVFCSALFSCDDISTEQRKLIEKEIAEHRQLLAKEIAALVLKGMDEREAKKNAYTNAFMNNFLHPDNRPKSGNTRTFGSKDMRKHTSAGQENKETDKKEQ